MAKTSKHAKSKASEKESSYTWSKRILYSALMFLLGAGLGFLSKWLDTLSSEELPAFFETVDIRNMFGRTAIWALIAVSIAVFSRTSLRAAVNVLMFFAGVLLSYWIASIVLAGFMIDDSYMMVWIIFAAVSPIFGFLTWYARREGIFALIIAAFIFAYFFLQAFSFDATLSYFDLNYGGTEAVMLAVCVAILFVRKPLWQTPAALGAAIVLAYAIRLTGVSIPYLL